MVLQMVAELLILVLLAGLLLLALFFVVRAAVEGGVRRALRTDLLRPSLRELMADPSPRPRPPAEDRDAW